MRTSAPLVTTDMTLAGFPRSPESLFDVVTVFAFNGSQTGVEELALGHDDHIKPWRNLVTTESLSNETFSSISLDRSTQAFRGGNPEPSHWHPGRQNE